jgi:hypothetical protein
MHVSATIANVILIRQQQQQKFFNCPKLPSSNRVVAAIQYEPYACHAKLGNQFNRTSNITLA